MIPAFGKTRPDPSGRSTPDEAVIAGAAARFLRHDRVCLLTGDGGRDFGGMRSILDGEIEPALRIVHVNRLGLLVLFRRPGSTPSQYHQAVEKRSRLQPLEPGYAWEETG
jgi:hypothetical protein